MSPFSRFDPTSAAEHDATEFLSLWVDPAGHWEVHPILLVHESGGAWSTLGLDQLDPARFGGPDPASLRYLVQAGWPRAGSVGKPPYSLPPPIQELQRDRARRELQEQTRSATLPFALACRLYRLDPATRAQRVEQARERWGAWLATGDVTPGPRGELQVGGVGELPRKVVAAGLWAEEVGHQRVALLVPRGDLDEIEQAEFTRLHQDARRRAQELGRREAPVCTRRVDATREVELPHPDGRRTTVHVIGVSTVDEAERRLWASTTASPTGWATGCVIVGAAVVAAVAGWALWLAPIRPTNDPATEANAYLEDQLSAHFPGCEIVVKGLSRLTSRGGAMYVESSSGIELFFEGRPCYAAIGRVRRMQTTVPVDAEALEELLAGGSELCARPCIVTRAGGQLE